MSKSVIYYETEIQRESYQSIIKVDMIFFAYEIEI